MVLQAYEYEIAEGKPLFLEEFFSSTRKFFETSHPKVKDLVTKLYSARENGIPFSKE
jgi:hypothetical protein